MPRKPTGKPSGRPRRPWDEYPRIFLQITEHFASSNEPIELPFKQEHQMWTHRTQFYRFFEAVRFEYNQMHEQPLERTACGLELAYYTAKNVLIQTSKERKTLRFELSEYADANKPKSIDERLSDEKKLAAFRPALIDARAMQQQAADDKGLRSIKEVKDDKVDPDNNSDLLKPDGSMPSYEELFGVKPDK